MTVIQPNSIAGINSITVQTGQSLNIHDASGNLIRNLTTSSGVSTYQSLHIGAGTTTATQGVNIGTGASIGQNTVNELHFFTSGTNHFGINNEGQLTCQGTGSQINLTKTGSDATEVTATLYTSNSGTHNQVTIKTSTNNGGDPYIKFDGGGQDMIVGERYAGTTNNLLVLGPGSNPDTTTGIFVKGTGIVGVNSDSPSKQLEVQGTDVAFRLKSTVATGRIGMEFYDTAAQKGFFGYPSSGNDQMSIQQNEVADLYFNVNGSERLRMGHVGVSTFKDRVGFDTSSAIKLPRGTTSERPTDTSSTTPYMRWNSTNSALEVYNGSEWVEIITDYFPSGSTAFT